MALLQASRFSHAARFFPAKNPSHRLWPDRHRAGLRVRLFRRAGLQSASRGRLRRRAGELEPSHDHDRSRVRRPHLHRADHARSGGKNHRAREAGRASADAWRPDRAQLRDEAGRERRPRKTWCPLDRRECRRDPQRRGPAGFQGSDGENRPRCAALRHRAHDRGRPESDGRDRIDAAHHPTRLHPRRLRRRHRLQSRGIRRDRRARARFVARERSADRGITARLERV